MRQMKNMKALLKLMSAVALSTVAASSVIACSDNSEGILLNKKSLTAFTIN